VAGITLAVNSMAGSALTTVESDAARVVDSDDTRAMCGSREEPPESAEAMLLAGSNISEVENESNLDKGEIGDR